MKLSNTSTHIKVPLSCLRITSNVRQDFDEVEIEELAQSIKENGLVNAITVKPPKEEDGVKVYEVIAGGRRIRAHQWLCDHGDDFSMIDCKISTGDMWTIQMVENIQRTDLSPREKENAVMTALDSGMTQKQISEKLSKPIQWISDIFAGAKVRKIADAAGIETDSIGTKTLSQLRSIPEDELPEKLRQLAESGGTYRTATKMAQAQKEENAPVATTSASNEDAEEDVFAMEEKPVSNNAETLEEEQPICSNSETVAPDPEVKTRDIVNKPDCFIWKISNELDMEAAILSLGDKIKKMPQNTKLCIKDCGRVLTISGIEYRPGTDELVFLSQSPDARVLG